MLTGRFAPVNRVTQTFLWPGLPHQDRQPNIASLLKETAGYEVFWKGKWHLSYAANAAPGNGGEDWGPADIAAMEKNWGWAGWNPPDAGNAIQEWQGTPFGKFDGLRTLGGGRPDNDGRFVNGPDPSDRGQTAGVGGESVVEFLKNRARKLDKPFCMFVSLVNPHDTGARTLPTSASCCPTIMPTTFRPSPGSRSGRATPTTSSPRSRAPARARTTSISMPICTPWSTSTSRRCSTRWKRPG
jgi:arylsulfatase A-like enzyme